MPCFMEKRGIFILKQIRRSQPGYIIVIVSDKAYAEYLDDFFSSERQAEAMKLK